MHNYSSIQKFLHDFVLKKKFINKSLFELEKIIFSKNLEIKNKSHIFITGLPRSGSTTLLNFFHSSNQFKSLTYKNMPFVLSPNFSKFLNKKTVQKVERLHSDGIFFNNESPEAFDEVFFNNDEKFIKDELENYIKLILISGNKSKYLSKNNFNYQRINLIKSILPNSMFLILIRDPIQQSRSLLKQHLNFSNLQKRDDFIKRYMDYLGHKEFGLSHKSWNKSVKFKNFNDINYWLEQWFFFYENIYKNYKSNKNCFFLIYEKLSNPSYIESLLKEIKLDNFENMNFNYFKNFNKNEINIDFDAEIYENSINIYNKFISLKT